MNNPPAFPGRQKALMIKSEHIGIASEYEIEHNGMTLRDYFAAKALPQCFEVSATTDIAAREAYRMADAMMKAREQ